MVQKFVPLGAYGRSINDQLVQVISCMYKKDDDYVVDVRLVSDPFITFTSNVNDLEIIDETV